MPRSRRGSERAPHKPLLLLLALARCTQGGPRQIPYAAIDGELRELLIEFGPSRKSYHTEYPFWRLQNDGIWELENADSVESRASNKDAKKSDLLKYGVTGGLTTDIYDQIRKDPYLVSDLAQELLDAHFPPSMHEDILAAVGLDAEYTVSRRRKRDPEFRQRVLTAYEYRCRAVAFLQRWLRQYGLQPSDVDDLVQEP